MRAGPPEVLRLQEAPTPIPRSGEVRIRVEACGVNFADVVGRMGAYADAPPIPYVPGYEVAGVVEMIGQGVPDLREGDKVFGVTQFGGYSDTICVPHKQIFRRLEWMNPADAVALPVNYLTAFLMLVVMGSLRPGNKVLIHNAAGGVGIAALDICKIIGAETFGTASPQKHNFLLERGLDHAIDYRNRDYEQILLDLTGGKGVHIALDPMGGVHWRKNYRLVMPTGRLIHFGVSSFSPGKRRSWWHTLRGLLALPFYTPIRLMNDNKAVVGVNLGHLWEHVEMQRPWMEQIVSWYDEALLRPHIDRTFSLEAAADAHHYVQDRKNVGKVLLIP